jgi:hypothetical protein
MIMKRLLFALALLASLAAAGNLAAQQFWYDDMQEYPVGGLTTNTTLWFPHPAGSLTLVDALITNITYTSGAAVNGQRLEINGLNREYVMRLFDQVNTSSVSSGPVYASFIVNASSVSTAGDGGYFACFNGVYPYAPPDGTSYTNSFQFRGRVFEIGTTNGWPFTNSAPGTYVIGVANAENNPAQSNPGPDQVVPIDLAENVDYQVVLKYDLDLDVAYVWVNPAFESDTANMAGPTDDLGAVTNGLAGLLFRQYNGGTMDIRDVVVGYSFADVMTNTCGPVLIATNYTVVSNYVANPGLLEVFATSIGGGPLSYQWYQISGGVTNPVGGNSQKYIVPSMSSSDAAYYFCAVTNSCGQGAVSSTNFQIAVNTTATAPVFSLQPASTTNLAYSVVTLTCAAVGTGPLTYTWTNGTTKVTDGTQSDGTVIYGSQTPSLTLSNISFKHAGSYFVTVQGAAAPNAVSTNAVITVTTPAVVPIAYLRSPANINTNTWQATNTSKDYAIQGVITVYTNQITDVPVGGSYAPSFSYYIQDGTGGLNLFGYVASTAGPAFRPQMGDIVLAIGVLSTYRNNLELESEQDYYPYEYVQIIGHTNSLPAPMVFTPSLTNNPSLMETNIEGRLIMLTNVYFPAFTNVTGSTITVTNGGMPFAVNFAGNSNQDLWNRTNPAPFFAWTVTGPCIQYTNTSSYVNAGYEINVTRWADIVTNAPPRPTVSATVSGKNVVLNWAAVPYDISVGGGGGYAYSVWSSPTLGSGYQPLVTGLSFSTTNGVYTVTNALPGTQRFYRISSP